MPIYVDDRGNRFFGMAFDLAEDGSETDHFQEKQFSGRGIFQVNDGGGGLLTAGPWISLVGGAGAGVVVALLAAPGLGLPVGLLTFLAVVGLLPGLVILACTSLHRIDRRIRLAPRQPSGLLWFPVFQGIAMIPGGWALWRLAAPTLPQEPLLQTGLQGFCGMVAVLGGILIVQQVLGVSRMRKDIDKQRRRR